MNIEMAEQVLKLLAHARNSAAEYSYKNILYGKIFKYINSTYTISSMLANRSETISYPYNASYSAIQLGYFIEEPLVIDLTDSEREYLKMLHRLDIEVNLLDHKLFRIYRSSKAFYKGDLTNEIQLSSMNFSTRQFSVQNSNGLMVSLDEITFQGLPYEV